MLGHASLSAVILCQGEGFVSDIMQFVYGCQLCYLLNERYSVFLRFHTFDLFRGIGVSLITLDGCQSDCKCKFMVVLLINAL